VEAFQGIIFYQFASSFLTGLPLLPFTDHHFQEYLQSASYLQISVGIEILIFSVRTPGFWFLSKPANLVIASIILAIVVISAFASSGVLNGKTVSE
jgi:hypothetical protein